MSWAARVLQSFIRGYQRVFGGRVSPCRYIPSCSQYALEAVEDRGALRGSVLAVQRLLRCNPLGGHGWDPVPRRHRHERKVA